MISEDMLSQDEIDALLKGTDEDDDHGVDTPPLIDDYLSIMEQDTLGEIGNISFGSSATALSTLLSQKVEITTPTLSLVDREDLQREFSHPYVAIQVTYTDGFSGVNLLVIKQTDAAIIADLMLGGDGLNPPELLGDIQLSAVQEAMNQMMGSAATSMSTVFRKKVDISPPSIDLLNIQTGEGEEVIPPDNYLVKISFRLKIGNLIDSNIMQLLPVKFSKELVNELMNASTSDSKIEEKKTVDVVQDRSVQTNDYESGFGQANIPLQESFIEQQQQQLQQQQQMMYQQQPIPMQTQAPNNGPQYFGTQFTQPSQSVNVQPANFSSFEPYHLQESEAKNLDMLLDIPLQVTVELGRTDRSIKEILELASGSIIELDKLAGEPVDILVNNRLIAKGEVVVIDENFGVRVTDILSQSDRLKKLR
ncbi:MULTISPECIES: flagellar motor switch phosphatase FliY [Bacillus]|uniref:flagellar motor switch phosphatase FliY n=1 Tax=Bacillus TaxID=1386 RepID=UPI000477231F|nr:MULTISPECIES: flagellar motor switch phosphatase FliY [Bacillus]